VFAGLAGVPGAMNHDARVDSVSGNLAARVVQAARRWPERVALAHGGTTITFAQLERRSAQAAALLRANGIAMGSRVALQLPNVPAFAFFYYGALRLGAIVVPMNPLLKEREVAHNIGNSGAEVLVWWHAAAEPAWELERSGQARVLAVSDSHGARLLDRVEPAAELAVVAEDATAVLLYTSGTTGKPKGAELTHRNLSLNATVTAKQFSIGPEDRFLGALPLYHSFGQTCVLNTAVEAGARVALLTRFEAEAALELIERERVTVLMGVPTMLAGLAQSAVDRSSFRSVRVCLSGGAPLPRELMREFEHVSGVVALEGYGLSETSPVASLNHPAARRPGSIGQPVEGVEMKIVGEDGSALSPGEIGEIVIRGHNIMKGYWANPEATREAITDGGWFHSGDLGRVDEKGFFYVVGRVKDMIIRGGLNVYPREVEEVIHQHPAVSEAAVVGVSDERLGEEVAAAVALRAGATVEPQELQDWIKARVAAYKYPRYIWLVDELPKGPTGKILKRAIHRPAEVQRVREPAAQ
jgi:long-chain acyl-CoA synthetase